MSDRVISLAAATVLDAEPQVAVDAASYAGFDSVGIRWDFERFANIKPGRVRRHLDDSGVELLDFEVARLHPTIGWDSHRRLVDIAAELYPRWLLVVSHHVESVRTRDELLALAELVAPLGCGIALEFMAFTQVRTVDVAVGIASDVRAAGGDNVAVLVDALHLSRSGGRPEDLPSDLVEHLSYVQVCDALATAGPPSSDPEVLAAEARHARLFPGEGDLPLVDLLAVIPAATPISVEVQSDYWMKLTDPFRRAAQAMATTVRTLEC